MTSDAPAGVDGLLTTTVSEDPAPLHSGLFRELLWRPTFSIPFAIVILFCVMAAFPQLFAGWFGHGDPNSCNIADSGVGPRSGHPFGFDIQGCDLYANVIYGARNSISIGLLTTAIMLLIAVLVGSIAGYFRGIVDALISRTMDVFFGFPTLVGMIVVLEAFPVHNVLSVSLVLAIFSWPIMTRVMRGSVIATRDLDFIAAARGLGVSNMRILSRHVIPNSIGSVAVLTSLSVGGVITAESGLTFLGVGLKAPSISWGVQLASAQQYFQQHLNLLIFPSLFLSVAVLSLVMMGDTMRDVLDPRLR